jgi:dolichol kinase
MKGSSMTEFVSRRKTNYLAHISTVCGIFAASSFIPLLVIAVSHAAPADVTASVLGITSGVALAGTMLATAALKFADRNSRSGLFTALCGGLLSAVFLIGYVALDGSAIIAHLI